MKTKILNKEGKVGKEIELPKNFSKKVRKDIVLKVFEAQKREQSHGVKIGAGAGYSASGISSKKRHDWKGTYGKGISRIPRKIMSRHGSSFNWVGATATNTRGGRTAHPSRTEKNQFRKINKKEFLTAMNSCFSASADSKRLKEFYGIETPSYPLILEESILDLKTKDFLKFLKEIFKDKYEKALKKKTRRSGRGKMRGRKYRSTAGILVVLSEEQNMKRKGVDVVKAKDLSITDLTMNGETKRLIAYTEKALKEIETIWKA